MIFTRLRRSLMILSLLLVFTPMFQVAAQNTPPIYTVQPGDTLGGLSSLFHTTQNRLISANNISDPNVLTPGMQLFIPSLEGYSGTVTLQELKPGDTLHILARRLQIPETDLQRFNFITQPESLPLGAQVILVNANQPDTLRVPVTPGMTDLELAAAAGINRWTASEINGLKAPWDLVQNDTLFLPVSTGASAGELIPGVASLEFSPLPFKQGKTELFSAGLAQGFTLSGTLLGQKLESISEDQNLSTAYGGVARMTIPGIYPLVLTSTSADGSTFSLLQNVNVEKVTTYGIDTPFKVADMFVDPAVTGPEMDQILQIVSPITPEKYWHGGFRAPTKTPDCISSTYGRLRSYNGSQFNYFHSGIDFCGSDKTQIFAAADGVVVFTGNLTVRGNATIIDHGRGVYTGYWHQSKIMVNVGDRVTAGQVIGIVGATGRVTGPHLHFEVFVDGVQVDPTEWLKGDYP